MNNSSFDGLVRVLADPTARRVVIRGLAGGALGAMVGAFGLDRSSAEAAGCVRLGKKCRRGGPKCCGGRCTGGKCACPTGRAPCRGRCCPTGQVCAGGGCCPPEGRDITCGAKGCGTKTNNCGQPVDCGSCGQGETCQNGQCACAASCAGKECGDDGCGGSCGTCAPGRICRNGLCACPDGQKVCRSACIPQGNCCEDGECPAGATCVNGGCRCPDDRPTVCNNICVDTEFDEFNCGSCGRRCTGTCPGGARQMCFEGQCVCQPQ